MGGSTNTILHLLAAAQEAELNYTLQDIDRLSRKVGQFCKVAPNTPKYHMEDVHRAGGIMAILGELDRAGLIHNQLPMVHSPTVADALAKYDIAVTEDEAVKKMYRAGPAGIPSQTAFSQDTRWPSLDLDRENGCVRSLEHAYSQEGGLAVLFGNIAEDGCVVKTSGVDESILVFEGPAHICEAQEDAVDDVLNDRVKAGGCGHRALRRPERWPRHAGNALPDFVYQIKRSGQGLRLAHRWSFLRWYFWAVDRSRFARSSRRWRYRPG